VGNLVSAGAALSIGPLTRRFNEHWLLLAVILLAIVSIAITPMLDTVAVLLIAMSFRGVGQGLNLPLMLSIASRAVGRDFQGRVAALRIAFNRLGSMLVPFAMGAIAEFFGLEIAFYIVGLCGVVLTGLLAVWLSRQPELKRSESAV
jgi:MFS family permease